MEYKIASLFIPGTPILIASMIPSLIRWGLLPAPPKSGLKAGTAVRRSGEPEQEGQIINVTELMV